MKTRYLVVGALTLAPASAFAYIDPGTGSMALQAAIAAVAGTMVGLHAAWARLKSLVLRKQPESSLTKNDSAKQDPLDRA